MPGALAMASLMMIAAMTTGKMEKKPKPIFPAMKIRMVEIHKVIASITAPVVLVFRKTSRVPAASCATPNKIIVLALNPISP